MLFVLAIVVTIPRFCFSNYCRIKKSVEGNLFLKRANLWGNLWSLALPFVYLFFKICVIVDVVRALALEYLVPNQFRSLVWLVN